MSKPFKLPKKFAEQWLEALKSGKFHQARGTLVDSHDNEDVIDTKYGNSYCCLGVGIAMHGYSPLCMIGHDLPMDLVKKEGFPKSFPSLLAEDTDSSVVDILTKLNDTIDNPTIKRYSEDIADLKFPYIPKLPSFTIKYSFEQIAEFIELNFEFIDDEE